MPGMSASEKKARLAKISYQDFLLNYAKVHPEVLPFLGGFTRNSKKVDSTPALESAEHGSPGTNGLGLKFEEIYNENSYRLHFPDGNASIARLLVSRLIPSTAAGKTLDMNNVVQAQCDYDKLDAPAPHCESASVVQWCAYMNEGSPNPLKIAYRTTERLTPCAPGTASSRATTRLISALMPEIPERQKDALAYPVKCP